MQGFPVPGWGLGPHVVLQDPLPHLTPLPTDPHAQEKNFSILISFNFDKSNLSAFS